MRDVRNCEHPTCDRPRHGSRYCNAHYLRSRKGADMDTPLRTVTLRHGPACEFAGCDLPYWAKGLCSVHYLRQYAGRPMEGPPRKNPRIPGETRDLTAAGYVRLWLPDHPAASGSGWLFEHRYLMEQRLGRRLVPGETVHHRNGIRSDNRPENLELWSKMHPNGQRVSDLVDFARRVLDLYG